MGKRGPGRGLTDKQEAFCQHYVKHWNATRAAKEAGYSVDSAHKLGFDLLRIPLVCERIDQLTEHALKEIGVTRARVLTELSRIAFTNMKDLSNWTESGVHFIAADDMEDEKAAAVAEVTEVTNQHGGTLKIKQHDKVRALELLGRHLKLYADRVEHSGPDGAPIRTESKQALPDDQLDARIGALLAKGKNDAKED